jgi:hypothetical protein
MKIKKNNLITVAVIAGVIILVVILLSGKNPTAQTSAEVAQCIGGKSTLYVQLGCPHCETQKEMFGENYQYLKTIDCFYERDKCTDVSGTPTWKIGGEYYVGIQSVEKLRELTGC